MSSVTTKRCLVHTWEIYVQHISAQRDHPEVTHISKILRRVTGWVVASLYINWISFLQLISLYWRVTGAVIDVICIVNFVESGWENIFSLSNLLILTVVTEVTVGIWGVYGRRLVFLSLSRAEFRILYYKQYLDKKCGVQKNCCLDDNYFWKTLGLCLHCWFYTHTHTHIYIYIYIYKRQFLK